MVKRVISVILALVMSVGIVCSSAVTVGAAAAVAGTVTGTMQDTSDASNGVLNWSFTYDKTKGTASLTITGDGYMPNATDDSWFTIQNEVQCYVTSVKIGEGVKSIMENAFLYEIYLESITLPESIEYIGDNAFAYTGIKSINIPSKVDYLSGKMFYNSPIESINVSQANPYFTSFNGDVYSKDMKTLVVSAPGKFVNNSYYDFSIPSSVNIIAPYAFYMSQIKEIVIPGNVTEIRNMAFAGSDLEALRIDSGLKMIYDSAFLSCTKLTEYVLPSTLTYLGWYSVGYGYELDVEGVEYVLDSNGVSHGVININNCQSYLEQIGYTAEQFMVIAPISSVSIYAVITTVGEDYAKENGFSYTPTYIDYARPLSAKAVRGGVQVSWVPVPSAIGYRILRKNEINEWEVIGTATGEKTSSYIDTKPVNNYVNEYSVMSYGIHDSGYYDKQGVSCYHLNTPRLLSATNSSSGVTVCWEAVNGAYSYTVYRKKANETIWSKYSVVSGGVTSFTDADVEANVKYCYTVSAENPSGNSFYNEQGISVTFLLSPTIRVYNISTGMGIKWTYSGTADSFEIYRKTSSSDWSLIHTASATTRAYKDTTVQRGVHYYYRVEVVCNGSSSVNPGVGGSYFTIESPMKFTVQNRVSGVMVKWSKCAGATGYYIYRKPSKSSRWKRIAVVNGGSTLSYLDKDVKSGSTYIYTIKAFNGKYMSNYNSNGRQTIFLSTPKAYNIKSTSSGISMNYKASPGAQGYYIYRKNPGSPWKRIGIVKNRKTTYYCDKTAKKGQTYIYTIRAYKNGVRSSYYSNGKRIKDIY